MKRIVLLCGLTAAVFPVCAQWAPAGEKIRTRWADEVNPANVWAEYPRPQMERADWLNLNGLWDYAIRPRGAAEPARWEGKILVPFAVESSLSGVQKTVGEENELWYTRRFDVPQAWKGRDILLQFGAVDWAAYVYVNDILIGEHEGGYTPFTFNITPFLNGNTAQKLTVRVWDPTDRGYQATGKQRVRPEGIWYTPVTGIWQTVWLEPVAPANHITYIRSIPDVDNSSLSVTVNTAREGNDIVEVKLMDKGTVVASGRALAGREIRLGVENPTLWEPENPYLYDMTVAVLQGNRAVDRVESYTAFRKISYRRDENGIVRIQLNNKNLYQHGPLDQGWWPDGLYTAPTDQALAFDIEKTKELGFNMIRKHVKVEPARWYYHCDRMGMLVWQDMPNGDMGRQQWQARVYGGGADRERTERSVTNYYKEWQAIMDFCMSSPSVVIWVPFNEAWGQFDTEQVVAWTKAYDPSRLVNPASGGNHRNTGDLLDLHNYPGPDMYLYDGARVNVLGEYGGIGLPLESHLWNPDMRNWGYIEFKNARDVTDQYVKYIDALVGYVDRGFSASVYTQTTDVEGEINGLMTYDRRVVKVVEPEVREANRKLINSLK